MNLNALFLSGMSGIMSRDRKNMKLPTVAIMAMKRMSLRCLPIVKIAAIAANMDTEKHPYTFFRCCTVGSTI